MVYGEGIQCPISNITILINLQLTILTELDDIVIVLLRQAKFSEEIEELKQP